MTFSDEDEGDAYAARVEALLDRGIIPPEFEEKGNAPKTLADVIRVYHQAMSVPDRSPDAPWYPLSSRFSKVLARMSGSSMPWVERICASSLSRWVAAVTSPSVRSTVRAARPICARSAARMAAAAKSSRW